jgi:RNA polymerase sigma factor (sigma-70 family)
LQAVVRQLAVDAHRKSFRFTQIETDADFDAAANEMRADEKASQPAADFRNQEHALAGRQSAQAIEAALARALKELDAEDRLLARLYYFDELSLREAGAILGVHEATASRRLTRLQKDVRRRIENILIKEHNWTSAETRHALAEAVTQLDTNLEALLSAGEPAREKRSAGDANKK